MPSRWPAANLKSRARKDLFHLFLQSVDARTPIFSDALQKSEFPDLLDAVFFRKPPILCVGSRQSAGDRVSSNFGLHTILMLPVTQSRVQKV